MEGGLAKDGALGADGEEGAGRTAQPRPLAQAHAVDKRFGAIAAVRGVTCAFRPGKVHAVCGENGAGKSTLLKLVAGMLVPDAGEVEVDGRLLQPHTPREAIHRGVAMVLQHFALVPVFSALENIILGAEPTGPMGILDLGAARSRAEKIAKDLGVTLPLDTRLESLGIGDRQRVEIARALFRDARLVILDEPTAVLTKTEAGALYALLRRLADQGKGIVVVTHKMDEVRAHADVVSVMRRGELVFTRELDRKADLNAQVDEVTAAIMGAVARTPYRGELHERAAIASDDDRDSNNKVTTTDEVLVMKDVRVGRGLSGVTLTLHAGETVGVAGIEGNGQKELVAVLAGDVVADSGSITGGPFAIVREDRQTEGLVLDATLRDNLMLGELGRYAHWGILDANAIEKEAAARLDRSGAIASSTDSDLDRAARTLSGGNQQKIVVARALARNAKVVIASQPTRGVDLAASLDIHTELVASAKRGAGVLVISADLDELRKLASRILVLARGRIVADLPPTVSDDDVGRLMLGMKSRSEDKDNGQGEGRSKAADSASEDG